MARMWKVRHIDCSREFAWNAREVMSVRIDEAYAHARSLDDPLDAVGHHDLRISLKRLRYSLEFFAVCYDAAHVEWILERLSQMQDLLGDLHDAEVLVPEMQHVLGDLSGRRSSVVHHIASARAKRKRPMSYERFAMTIEDGAGHEARPGLLGLINRLRRMRRDSYREAVRLWAQLEAEGFRDRLETLKIIRVEPAPAAGVERADEAPA